MTHSNGVNHSPIDTAVQAFLDDAVSRDPKTFTSTADLIAAARQWCDARGEYPFGARALARHLRQRGFPPWNTGKLRGWVGVRLR